jgi:hypothetical protein
MSTPEKTSTGAVAACIFLSLLALLALLAHAFFIALLTSLTGSDAAGNAYSQAFAAIAFIIVWLLLALITLIAAIKGSFPLPAIIAAIVLIPTSGLVVMDVQGLLSRPNLTPYLWPIVIPVLIPAPVIAFSFWALSPRLRTAIPARIAVSAIWGAVFLLCAAVVPFDMIRNRADDDIAAARAKIAADYARLPTDAPLQDLLPFMASLYDDKVTELRNRVRNRAGRQAEAEAMLVRGDFPLRYLNQIDLDPTPSLCEKARAQLRQQAAPLVLKTGETKPYAIIAQRVSDAVVAMKWLVGYDCSCDAESRAWEDMAKAYTGTNFDVFELARLRDPKELGRILNHYPERFSMLTSKAHLKAWLKFADDKQYRDRALAGARQLDHRTADATEMLRDKLDISAPWQVLKHMPALDLEPTPALCAAVLMELRNRFDKTFRPAADDQRSYSELLARLGADRPLTALAWVAGHGCDAEAELSLAEDLIRSYQDSFDRQMMLRSLGSLRRKP